MKTLIGNGWLRESPKNLWPRGWDIKSRSALRKCVFLPVPPEAAEFLRALPPPKPFSAVPPRAPAQRPATPPFRRSDPQRNARAFDAISPEQVAEEQRKRLFVEAQRAAMGKKPAAKEGKDAGRGPERSGYARGGACPEGTRGEAPDVERARAWYEDPVALGTLLILVPPIGLAALWSSKRYSSDARWALTIMTGLTMFLVAAVFVALTALQSR